MVRVALGSDEHTPLVDSLRQGLLESGHDVLVVADAEPWPDVGRLVGQAVSAGEADRGVVCCWTGTGVSIAANKVPGIRAALCTDAETAKGARRWNDANVLALGLRLTSAEVAREMLSAFLGTDPDPGEETTLARLSDGVSSSLKPSDVDVGEGIGSPRAAPNTQQPVAPPGGE